MKYSEFAEKLTEIYNGKFKESKLYIKPWNQFGKSIYIIPSLSGNVDECINKIAGNDMFHIKFDIELPENFNFESDDLPEYMVLKNLDNSYLIIPESRYLYYGRRKISFRKTTGTAEKLLETFGKFTDKLYQSIIDDRASGNIHNNYIDIVNRKIA